MSSWLPVQRRHLPTREPTPTQLLDASIRSPKLCYRVSRRLQPIHDRACPQRDAPGRPLTGPREFHPVHSRLGRLRARCLALAAHRGRVFRRTLLIVRRPRHHRAERLWMRLARRFLCRPFLPNTRQPLRLLLYQSTLRSRWPPIPTTSSRWTRVSTVTVPTGKLPRRKQVWLAEIGFGEIVFSYSWCGGSSDNLFVKTFAVSFF